MALRVPTSVNKRKKRGSVFISTGLTEALAANGSMDSRVDGDEISRQMKKEVNKEGYKLKISAVFLPPTRFQNVRNGQEAVSADFASTLSRCKGCKGGARVRTTGFFDVYQTHLRMICLQSVQRTSSYKRNSTPYREDETRCTFRLH